MDAGDSQMPVGFRFSLLHPTGCYPSNRRQGRCTTAVVACSLRLLHLSWPAAGPPPYCRSAPGARRCCRWSVFDRGGGAPATVEAAARVVVARPGEPSRRSTGGEPDGNGHCGDCARIDHGAQDVAVRTDPRRLGHKMCLTNHSGRIKDHGCPRVIQLETPKSATLDRNESR